MALVNDNNYNLFFIRYPLRIESMETKLEFGDKLADIKPAIETLKLGMHGKRGERGLTEELGTNGTVS